MKLDLGKFGERVDTLSMRVHCSNLVAQSLLKIRHVYRTIFELNSLHNDVVNSLQHCPSLV